MDHINGMAMVDCLEQTLHVAGGNLLSESLILLGGDHLKELESIDELHDEIDVLRVIVGLIILHNVGMV